MLTFFRRIRKGLLNSGNTGRYLVYAVGEIAVVVIGILIALHINNWNENNKTLNTESNSILRLHGESELIVQFFKDDIDRARGWIEVSEKTAKALSSKSLDDLDSITFINGVSNVGFFPAISPPRTVYDELNSSGKLMQIKSDSVRLKVAEYYASLDFILSQLTYFRQTVNNPIKVAKQDFYSVYDSSKKSKRKYQFNFDALAANKSFNHELTEGLRNLIIFQYFRLESLQHAKEMCRTLAKESGESCSSYKNEENRNK